MGRFREMNILLCHSGSANWYGCSGRKSGRNEGVKDADSSTSSPSLGWLYTPESSQVHKKPRARRFAAALLWKWGAGDIRGVCHQWNTWVRPVLLHNGPVSSTKMSSTQSCATKENKKILRPLLSCKFKTFAQNSSIILQEHIHIQGCISSTWLWVSVWEGKENVDQEEGRAKTCRSPYTGTEESDELYFQHARHL